MQKQTEQDSTACNVIEKSKKTMLKTTRNSGAHARGQVVIFGTESKQNFKKGFQQYFIKLQRLKK